MSFEASHLQRATSPASSARLSPINPRLQHEAGDASYKKDKNYRRYASAVERALSLFDTTLQEWADYISFLARLLKALQNRPLDITEVPHKSLVARRLAQCLNPALPSGVHQKTIEVYTHIFSVLGPHGLARDLPLYIPGLAPTLSYASLSIKPALLSLFENHILLLEDTFLRPALKAIILALLPGLEEETSEEYERTHSILIRLRSQSTQNTKNDGEQPDVSSDQYFWQCFFLASITSASRRQGALSFMVRNLPQLRFSSEEHGSARPRPPLDARLSRTEHDAMMAVIAPEPGLLIRSFAAGLRDEQLLVQRGFLDLLVTHLPLHSDVLQVKATHDDVDRLVSAAVLVVARREMSLNRRLWSWFLGPEVAPESQASTPVTPNPRTSGYSLEITSNSQDSRHTYFERYTQNTLVRSVLKMIHTDAVTPSDKARPFRICLSLMDRWEIGGAVVPHLLRPLLESVWRYQIVSPSQESFEEVFRSASVFFDGVESGLLWGEISRVLISSFGEVENTNDSQRGLDWVYFIVTKFNIREEEMQIIHMPLVLLVIVISLQRHPPEIDSEPLSSLAGLEHTALKIAHTLLDLIPVRAFAEVDAKPKSSAPNEGMNDPPRPDKAILGKIQSFYGKYRGKFDYTTTPFPFEKIGQLLLEHIVRLILQDIPIRHEARHLEMELSLLEKLARKLPSTEAVDRVICLSALMRSLDGIGNQITTSSSLELVKGTVSALETFSIALPSDIWYTSYQMRQIILDLVTSLWPCLSPSQPMNNVEAVRYIWRLQLVSPDVQLIEGCIATLLTDDCKRASKGRSIEGARRFTTLWVHSGSSINSLHTHRPSNLPPARADQSTDAYSTMTETVILGRSLMLLLDSLFEVRSEMFTFTTKWLHSLTNLHVIVQFLLRRLRATKFLNYFPSLTSSKADLPAPYDSTDLEECDYVLQVVTNLVLCSPGNISASLASKETRYDRPSTSGSQSTIALQSTDSANGDATIQSSLIQICLAIIEIHDWGEASRVDQATSLRRTAANLLQQMLLGQHCMPMLYPKMENTVTEALAQSVRQGDDLLQTPFMDLLVVVMRSHSDYTKAIPGPMYHKTPSKSNQISRQRSSTSADSSEREEVLVAFTPPPALLECLLLGLSSPGSYPVLERWVQFLDDCLACYADNAFAVLMPLVDCFNKSIRKILEPLQALFDGRDPGVVSHEPLISMHSLLNGLENSLAQAHDRLVQQEIGVSSIKTPEQSQGFFGNMVSGVFAIDPSRSKSTTANSRLTVLLCFKDAILVCLEIWLWASHGQSTQSRALPPSASLNYATKRLKNRTRRILEHLFAAEALECLETLIEVWYSSRNPINKSRSSAVFSILQVLDSSRPKNTMPALFNAIYSRTNPNALDHSRKSSLTADLSDIALADFLVQYIRSLEDDAMDEIWSDCMTFLKDVLTNPLPQRQTLPRLLEFTAILGEKIGNTNFGEQKKMRRDLGDLFVRLMAAMFTAKPLNFAQDDIKTANVHDSDAQDRNSGKQTQADDVVGIIASILPKLPKILVDPDRVTAASSIVTLQVLAPTIQSKAYPCNVMPSTLRIFIGLSQIPEASKSWRKVVAEAFNDSRFFCSVSRGLVEDGWLPVLRQLTVQDKDRMQDYISRIVPPTAAGIMFGVGASSARLEADRKTQLILRRMVLLILASADDTYVMNLVGIQEKILELLTATAASSPSSATRAELCMLLRALVLKISAVHLASFWPVISSELSDALSSLFPGKQDDTYSMHCVLQACKLLDTLVTLAPDEFQLREWLFITDTVDAVYRPHTWSPVALVDELAEDLDSYAGGQQPAPSQIFSTVAQTGKRRPLLSTETTKGVPREWIIDRILKPFFRQLSISAFECTYSMESPDWKACYDILLDDLFDESTMA